MSLFERALPGEFDGTLDVRDYGLEVVPVEPMTTEEEYLLIAAMHRQVHARGSKNGFPDKYVVIRENEKYLREQPFDPEPARKLAEKHDELSDSPMICEFGIAELEIDKGVFCPTLTKVSPFLYEHLPSMEDKRVLDAFCGSGAFAVNAALKGGTVVAYDKAPVAANCTIKNVVRNGVSDKVDTRLGTLREVIEPEERFDLIIANPPLIPGTPDGVYEQALFDEGLKSTIEFIDALPDLLTKRGECRMVTSDVIERRAFNIDIEQVCKKQGLAVKTVAALHLPYESYRVHRISRSLLSRYAGK